MAKTEKVPAFQFYPKDFLTDERVRLMTHTEIGIYMILLCTCWLEGSLPIETKSLAMLVHLPLPRFTKFWEHSVVKQCFYVAEDGRLHHPRLEAERAKQEAFKRRQSDNVKGRWNRERGYQTDTTVLPDRYHTHTRALKTGEEEPDQKEQRPTKSSGAAPPSNVLAAPDVGDRAAELLEKYPILFRKHRRGAFTRIKPALDFQRACDICAVWTDDARLEKLIEILLTTDDEWIAKTDRGFGVFAAKVSWCDDRLKQWELEHGVAV